MRATIEAESNEHGYRVYFPEQRHTPGEVIFFLTKSGRKSGYDKMTTFLKITLENGRIIFGRADFGKGSLTNPMSYDEVADKFLDCAAFAEWPTSKAKQVIDLVRNLEDLSDVRTLTALCSK